MHETKIELAQSNMPFLKRVIQYFSHNFIEYVNVDFNWCLTASFMQIVDQIIFLNNLLRMFLETVWKSWTTLYPLGLIACLFLNSPTSRNRFSLSNQHIIWWLRPPERWLWLFINKNNNHFLVVIAHKISFYDVLQYMNISTIFCFIKNEGRLIAARRFGVIMTPLSRD